MNKLFEGAGDNVSCVLVQDKRGRSNGAVGAQNLWSLAWAGPACVDNFPIVGIFVFTLPASVKLLAVPRSKRNLPMN